MKWIGCVEFKVTFEMENGVIPSNIRKLCLPIRSAEIISTISTLKTFEIESTSREGAFMMLGKEFGRYYKENNLKVFDVKYNVKLDKIMDTNNAHDPKLVEYINYIWCRKSKSFYPIIKALCERDIDEINDKREDAILNDLNDERYFADAVQFYLMQCADDGDLETIINFIRYREKIENTSNTYKYLYANGWYVI